VQKTSSNDSKQNGRRHRHVPKLWGFAQVLYGSAELITQKGGFSKTVTASRATHMRARKYFRLVPKVCFYCLQLPLHCSDRGVKGRQVLSIPVD
jgi:hypothetical protein